MDGGSEGGRAGEREGNCFLEVSFALVRALDAQKIGRFQYILTNRIQSGKLVRCQSDAHFTTLAPPSPCL